MRNNASRAFYFEGRRAANKSQRPPLLQSICIDMLYMLLLHVVRLWGWEASNPLFYFFSSNGGGDGKFLYESKSTEPRSAMEWLLDAIILD